MHQFILVNFMVVKVLVLVLILFQIIPLIFFLFHLHLKVVLVIVIFSIKTYLIIFIMDHFNQYFFKVFITKVIMEVNPKD